MNEHDSDAHIANWSYIIAQIACTFFTSTDFKKWSSNFLSQIKEKKWNKAVQPFEPVLPFTAPFHRSGDVREGAVAG